MDVVWHDDEAVEKEFLLVAITKESFDKQFSACRLLEMAMLAKR
jgi:hypothetical protein